MSLINDDNRLHYVSDTTRTFTVACKCVFAQKRSCSVQTARIISPDGLSLLRLAFFACLYRIRYLRLKRRYLERLKTWQWCIVSIKNSIGYSSVVYRHSTSTARSLGKSFDDWCVCVSQKKSKWYTYFLGSGRDGIVVQFVVIIHLHGSW